MFVRSFVRSVPPSLHPSIHPSIRSVRPRRSASKGVGRGRSGSCSEWFYLFPKLITSVEINKDHPHENRNHLLRSTESVGGYHHLGLAETRSKRRPGGGVEKLSGGKGGRSSERLLRWAGGAGRELTRRGVSWVISGKEKLDFRPWVHRSHSLDLALWRRTATCLHVVHLYPHVNIVQGVGLLNP